MLVGHLPPITPQSYTYVFNSLTPVRKLHSSIEVLTVIGVFSNEASVFS
jgi:hypothetical protein